MMTKNNITTRSYLKIALIIPAILILSVIFGCNPMNKQKQDTGKALPENIGQTTKSTNGQPKKVITVNVINAKNIKVDGKTVPLPDVQSIFTDLFNENPKAVIKIKMHKPASSELLTKFQKILQKAGALKINYSQASLKGKPSAKKPPLKISERNILRFYVDASGNIFIDKNQTSLSSVKEKVEKFITNNGSLDNLSESPKKTAIAIKMDKGVPYDTYTKTLNKIIKAYDELRNQASKKLFGQSFQSLREGSKQRKKIKSMYPKQISIAKPAGS